MASVKLFASVNKRRLVSVYFVYSFLSLPLILSAQEYSYYTTVDGVEFYSKISNSYGLLYVKCNNTNNIKVAVDISNLIWMSDKIQIAKYEGGMEGFKPGENKIGGLFWTIPKGYDKSTLSFRLDNLKIHIGGFGNDPRYSKKLSENDKSLENTLKKHPVNFDSADSNINNLKGQLVPSLGVRAENEKPNVQVESLAITNGTIPEGHARKAIETSEKTQTNTTEQKQFEQKAQNYLEAAKNSTDDITKVTNLNLAKINAIASNNKGQVAQIQQIQAQTQQQQTQQLIKSTADLVSGLSNILSGNRQNKVDRKENYRERLLNSNTETDQRKFKYLALSYFLDKDYATYRSYIEDGALIGSLWALKELINNYTAGRYGYEKDLEKAESYKKYFGTFLINITDTMNSLNDYSRFRDSIFYSWESPFIFIKPNDMYRRFVEKGVDLGNLRSIDEYIPYCFYGKDKKFSTAENFLKKSDKIIDSIIQANPYLFNAQNKGGFTNEKISGSAYYFPAIINHYSNFAKLYDGSTFADNSNNEKAIYYYTEYLKILNKVLAGAYSDRRDLRKFIRDKIEVAEDKIKTLSH